MCGAASLLAARRLLRSPTIASARVRVREYECFTHKSSGATKSLLSPVAICPIIMTRNYENHHYIVADSSLPSVCYVLQVLCCAELVARRAIIIYDFSYMKARDRHHKPNREPSTQLVTRCVSNEFAKEPSAARSVRTANTADTAADHIKQATIS